jgi:hypothetical protein
MRELPIEILVCIFLKKVNGLNFIERCFKWRSICKTFKNIIDYELFKKIEINLHVTFKMKDTKLIKKIHKKLIEFNNISEILSIKNENEIKIILPPNNFNPLTLHILIKKFISPMSRKYLVISQELSNIFEKKLNSSIIEIKPFYKSFNHNKNSIFYKCDGHFASDSVYGCLKCNLATIKELMIHVCLNNFWKYIVNTIIQPKTEIIIREFENICSKLPENNKNDIENMKTIINKLDNYVEFNLHNKYLFRIDELFKTIESKLIDERLKEETENYYDKIKKYEKIINTVDNYALNSILKDISENEINNLNVKIKDIETDLLINNINNSLIIKELSEYYSILSNLWNNLDSLNHSDNQEFFELSEESSEDSSDVSSESSEEESDDVSSEISE